MILVFLLSRAALPASSRTSAARYSSNGYKWMLKESLDELPKMPANMPYCGPLASPKEIKARTKKQEKDEDCDKGKDGKAHRLCGHNPREDDDSSSDSSEDGGKAREDDDSSSEEGG